MNNEELKKLHSNNHIHVNEKEYNGALITIANAVNAPFSFKIYSKNTQCKQMKLKSEGKNISKETKIPFVGNAIELSDYKKANLIIGDKYYIADYIDYDSQTNEILRYTVIDEELLDYNNPLKDQTQAIFFAPIVERINSTEDSYCFNEIKTIQDECNIMLISDNQFIFEKFIKLGNYNEVIDIVSSEQSIYRYSGSENYLYYNEYFFCDCDYEFSYETSGNSSVIVHFYDEKNNNISRNMLEKFEEGIYDYSNQGIKFNNNSLKMLFKEDSNINTYRFKIGFKVEQNEQFSNINFYKMFINNFYMELHIKSIKDIDFNLIEFSKNGKYTGIEYSNELDNKSKLFQYLGDEKYLYYHLFVPYNHNYNFLYEVSNLGETIIRFYDIKKRNVSFDYVDILEDGFYDEEQKGIKIYSTNVNIPFDETKTEIKYFQIGFRVDREGYFTNLELKKY